MIRDEVYEKDDVIYYVNVVIRGVNWLLLVRPLI